MAVRMFTVARKGSNYAQAVLQLTEEAPSLRVHNPDCPAGLDALLGRMISRDPDHRPMAKDLPGMLKGLLQS